MKLSTVPRALLPPIALAAAVAGLLALVGPAVAGQRCAVHSKNRLAPYLLSPCDGAAVKAHTPVTFTVFDRDPTSRRYPPYLSVSTSHRVVDGRLEPTTNGEGTFHQLSPVPGKRHTWTYTATPPRYASWWGNRPGTYYVQVEQVDYRPPNGTYSSPITTIRVR